MERTFAIIKPDAVSRGLSAEITRFIVSKGYKLLGSSAHQMSPIDVEFLYVEHKEHSNYEALVDFMSGGQSQLILLLCPNSIVDFKRLCGSADPAEAKTGTIRAIYGTNFTENVIHASDSKRSFDREISYFGRFLGI